MMMYCSEWIVAVTVDECCYCHHASIDKCLHCCLLLLRLINRCHSLYVHVFAISYLTQHCLVNVALHSLCTYVNDFSHDYSHIDQCHFVVEIGTHHQTCVQ